jgi:membrane-associated phospholipid phosphatase
LALTVLLLPPLANAQERLRWRDNWRRVGPAEYVGTAVMSAGALIVHQWVPPAQEPSWTRPVLIDWQTRRWLTLETSPAREAAATASDVLLATAVLQPLFADTLLVAGVLDRNPDVVRQMGVISLQAFALTSLLNVSAKRLFARQRPYTVGCQANPDYSDRCDDHDRFRSYYSGHAAMAATSAGLVCSHHTHLPLYGGGALDSAACAAALGMALASGVLRSLADRHWATDVITGYIVGFWTGYLLPTLLYYGSFRSVPVQEEPQTQMAALNGSPPPPITFSGSF